MTLVEAPVLTTAPFGSLARPRNGSLAKPKRLRLQFSTTTNTLGNWASMLIRHATHSPFSHVDIQLEDGTLLGASDSPLSPIIIGNARGVAIRPANYEDYGLRRLMIIDTPFADGIVAAAMSQIDKPFDPSALEGFWSDDLPETRDWKNTASWFCSELVVWAIEEGDYWSPKPNMWPKNRITPADIFMLFLFDSNWVNRETFWSGSDLLPLLPKSK